MEAAVLVANSISFSVSVILVLNCFVVIVLTDEKVRGYFFSLISPDRYVSPTSITFLPTFSHRFPSSIVHFFSSTLKWEKTNAYTNIIAKHRRGNTNKLFTSSSFLFCLFLFFLVILLLFVATKTGKKKDRGGCEESLILYSFSPYCCRLTPSSSFHLSNGYS